MSLNRRGALALISAAVASPTLASTSHLSPDEVIRRHTEARGGAAALDRVRAMAIDLDITEKGQTIAARYLASTEHLVRIDIVIDGKRVYSEGVDTRGVWLWPGDAVAAKDSTATGAANALIHGAETNLVGLHRFASRGHKLRLVEPQTLDSITYQIVEVTYSTGHVSNYFIDPADWMIRRKRDDRAYHPDMDPTKTWVESRYSDFHPVEGVVYSNRNEDYDLRKNALLSTAQVKRRTINPPIADGAFDRGYKPV